LTAPLGTPRGLILALCLSSSLGTGAPRGPGRRAGGGGTHGEAAGLGWNRAAMIRGDAILRARLTLTRATP